MRSHHPHRTNFLALCAATLLVLVAPSARADEPPSGHVASPSGTAPASANTAIAAPSEAQPTPTAANAPPDARRAVPDYSGRGPRRMTAGEALLWVPRVLLFPIYAITEYVIRAPLGWIVSNVERYQLVQRIYGVTHPTPGVTIAPTIMLDLGLVSSVGVYFALNGAGTPHNEIRFHASTGGPGYFRVILSDRYNIGPRARVGISGEYLERSDWRFYGIGPLTHTRDAQTFNWARGDVHAFVDFAAIEHFGLGAATGVRYDRFGSGPRIAPLAQENVPGVDDKSVGYGQLRAYVDTRPAGNPDTSGIRLDGTILGARDLDMRRDRSWLAYEIEGSAFLELKHPGRVLGLSAFAAFAHPLGHEPVPFVDLATLGGLENMQGFYFGRFRGESATVFTASYRYPVWYWLDGNIFASAGNAFGPALEGFDVRHLYGSAGIGFRTTGNRDMSFDALLAVGSTRFDEPFAVDSVRLSLGLNRGF